MDLTMKKSNVCYLSKMGHNISKELNKTVQLSLNVSGDIIAAKKCFSKL